MEFLGIDKTKAHPRALELLTADFFWNPADDLAPFGSDAGHTALACFREWRALNPHIEVGYCIAWVIESVGGYEDYDEYNEDDLIDEDLIKALMADPEFDDRQHIYTLDTSVIATAFGQLVDEGRIEEDYKYYVQVGIDRLKIWAGLQPEWEHQAEYLRNLEEMERVLVIA